jgi:hypothetical protein
MIMAVKKLIPSVLLALSCGASAFALETDVWISPNGIDGVAVTNVSTSDVVYGDSHGVLYPSNIVGTATYPFRCPDAPSLNFVLGSVLTNTYMTIHFMAGTFEVSSNGITPLTGWKLRGAGIDNTILRLMPGASSSRGVLAVIGGATATGNASESVEVSEMTIDCNMQNQTNFASVGLVAAVQLAGSQTRITRVKAINWGSANGNECHVLVSQPSSGHTTATNCVIEDCVVTQPAATNANASGATAIHMTPNLRGGIIRNNFINNIQSGGNGPVYFFAIRAGDNIRNNYVYDIISGNGSNVCGIYGGQDGYYGDVLIDGNVFDNVYQCVYFNNENPATNIVIKDNVLRPAEGGLGISYATTGTGNAAVTNLAIEGNIVYPCCLATNVTALGLNCSTYGFVNIFATVMDNIFQGGGSGYDLYFPFEETPNWSQTNYPYPLQLNTWAGNVNFLGTELNDATDAYWRPGNEDNVVFNPAADGWYRLVEGSGSGNGASSGACSGTITVESDIWGTSNLTDVQFTFAINGYASSTNNLGEINEIRRGAWAPQVIQARIGSDSPGDGPTYLDINVSNVSSSTRFVRVISDGHFRGRLLNPPVPVSSSPALSIVINL